MSVKKLLKPLLLLSAAAYTVADYACMDESLSFPTIDCVMADVRSSDGFKKYNSAMFYSYNSRGPNLRLAQELYDGYVYEEVPGKTWWNEVSFKPVLLGAKNRKDKDNRNYALMLLNSAALSMTAEGAAYFFSEKKGFIQETDSDINVWHHLEFPLLQRNDKIKSIVNVYMKDDYPTADLDGKWEKGDDMTPMMEWDPNDPRNDVAYSEQMKKGLLSKRSGDEAGEIEFLQRLAARLVYEYYNGTANATADADTEKPRPTSLTERAFQA